MTVLNYSERFSLDGMHGSFSTRVQNGLSSLKNETDYHQELKKRQAAAAAAQNRLYTVPYPEQSTGLTKYAPMGKRPGTTITAKSAPPVFPTSAFTVARTFLPIPTWQTTLTASQTFSTSGIENPVSFAVKWWLKYPFLIHVQHYRRHRLPIPRTIWNGSSRDGQMMNERVLGRVSD